MTALRMWVIFAPAPLTAAGKNDSTGDDARRTRFSVDVASVAGEGVAEFDERVERIIGDDAVIARSAFDALYRESYAELRDFAFRYVRNADAAHDVVQEVFVALWIRRRTWIPRGNGVAYLYGAVRNRALAHVAHAQVVDRFRSVGDPSAEMMILELPDTALERSDTQVVLRRAIEALPERQRDVVVLHFGRNLTVAEAARVLGVSHTAATNLLARAVARLRELFIRE